MKDILEILLADQKTLCIPITYILSSSNESLKVKKDIKEMWVIITYHDYEYEIAQNILMGLHAFRLPLINLPTLIVPIEYNRID